MTLPLILDGSLQVESPDGLVFPVAGEGPVLTVAFPTLRDVFRLTRYFPESEQRKQHLQLLQRMLALADLELSVKARGQVIATLDGRSRRSFLSRWLGLGQVRLSFSGIVRSILSTA